MDEYISVNEEDILYGEKVMSESCPVARAVRRAYRRYRVSVSEGGISVFTTRGKNSKVHAYFSCGPQLGRWIQDYDQNKKMDPMTIYLKEEDSSAEIIQGTGGEENDQ